mmetsp:Transcript_13701/g.42408  ORF Transcript_13701/g.42408 Transcript_13701/m.42408 type:complete len:199 (-) Transcript_13701:448-1044(-)
MCGDIQHRERWIIIGRLRNKTSLPPLTLTDHLGRRPKPLSSILDDPDRVSHNHWITNGDTDDFVQIFDEPQVYPEIMTPLETIPFSEHTLINNYENTELTTLLDRLRNERLTDKIETDRYLVLGAETPQEIISNPIVAKVYTLLYNTLHRNTATSQHDTYVIDNHGSKLVTPTQQLHGINLVPVINLMPRTQVTKAQL